MAGRPLAAAELLPAATTGAASTGPAGAELGAVREPG